MLKMKKMLAAILTMGLAVSLTGCGGAGNETANSVDSTAEGAVQEEASAGAEESGEEFWFAFATSLTVENADYGEEQLAALEIAVEQINEAGGIGGKTVKFDSFDDQGNPQEAQICAQKIVSDGKYEFALGYNSSGRFLASNPTYVQSGLPVIISSGTASKVTEQGFENCVRVCARDDVDVKVVIENAAQEMGTKKCVVMVDNAEGEISSYENVVPYLEENQIEVVDVQYAEVSERDYSAIITNWKAMDFDTIVFSQNYDHLALFMNQAVELGLITEDSNLVCINGSVNTAAFTDLVGHNADGMTVVAAYNVDSEDETYLEFEKLFREKTGAAPGEAAITTYTSFQVAAKAYNDFGTSSETLIDTIKANEFDTISGTASFDEKGDNVGCPGGICLITDDKIGIYDWKRS